MRRLAALLVLAACGTPVAAQDAAPLSPLPTATVAEIVAPAIVYAPAWRLDPPDTTTTAPAYLFVSDRPTVERWHTLALEVGWPDTEWRWLACVIWRESNGDPSVVYYASRDRSYGLLQINALAHHKAMVAFAGSEKAFLDPTVNLSFGWLLFQQAGRDPWKSSTKPCP